MKILLSLIFAVSAVVYAKPLSNSERAWTYFHPAWRVTSEGHLPIRSSEIVSYALDPHQRTEDEFRVSEELFDRVVFWMKIYGQYSSWMKVIHDSRDPRIVYGYIDYTPLYAKKLRRIQREIFKERIEKEVVRRLRGKLIEAAKDSDDEDSVLVRLFLMQFNSGFGLTPKHYAKRLRTQVGQRDLFLLALHRSPELLHSMETVFRDKGLPGGLTRLPFVESSFNPDAKSKTGAVGIWQFMPTTARMFIDPAAQLLWKDSMLQTHAAATVLSKNRRALPDWGITVTSYNSGIGRLYRLIHQHRIWSVERLLASQKVRLGFAGRNFYSEFLAALLVESYKDAFFPDANNGWQDGVFVSLLPSLGFECSN